MKVLHLDMDSFFATAEQQARPSLRGQPIGISIAPSRGGTVIGSSIEAKRIGIKTGTRVGDAKAICPGFVILPPNPARYRTIHRAVKDLMAQYSPQVQSRSIDEIAIWLSPDQYAGRPAIAIAAEIKARIRSEVGDWLSSSIGVGPNWWLAKTASNMRKPDGLLEITRENTRERLGELELTDLCGIARRMAARFHLNGIATPQDLYDAPPWELKRRFGIVGYYWHLRTHGYALDTAERPLRTLGHSSVIPVPPQRLAELKPLLVKLCTRTIRRLRKHRRLARRISVFIAYREAGAWRGEVATHPFDDVATMVLHAERLLDAHRLRGPARLLAVRVSNLMLADPEQPRLWDDHARRQRAELALDAVNDRWGELTLHPARMLGTERIAKDSIAFGQDMLHPTEELSPRFI